MTFEIFRESLHSLEVFAVDRLARFSAGTSAMRRRRIGALMAGLAIDILKIRVDYVRQTLVEHLGQEPDQASTLMRRMYAVFFTNAIEMAALPYLSREQVLQRLMTSDLSNLQEAHSRKRGVIIVSGHYGLWEIVPPWLTYHGFPMTSVVRRQRNPKFDQWMTFMREAHGNRTTDSGYGLRDILRTLKEGHLLGLMGDQNAGDRGMFVPFFGKPASTVVGPAQISQKMGSPIVVLVVHPCREIPHRLEISRPIYPEQFPAGPKGAEQITIAFTGILENWIRKKPENWFWLHKRWKSRPQNQPLEGQAT